MNINTALLYELHSVIFRNHSILARTMVDLECILGTMGIRPEYILNGRAFFHRASQTHTHTHMGNLEWEETGEWEETCRGTERLCKAPHRAQKPEFRIEPGTLKIWGGMTTHCTDLSLWLLSLLNVVKKLRWNVLVPEATGYLRQRKPSNAFLHMFYLYTLFQVLFSVICCSKTPTE